jgi:hypothetical protein
MTAISKEFDVKTDILKYELEILVEKDSIELSNKRYYPIEG